MRVLITGASGYIGGRLIRHLTELGGIQIRAAGRTARAWPEKVEGCISDVLDLTNLMDACRGVDAVFNLASMGESASAADPQGSLRVNGGGTLAWVCAATRAAVPRFVQVSTAKVYGANLRGVVTEETLCRPQSHYAITHRVAEDYAASQHPNSVILRVANGYGAPVDAAVDCWEVIVNDFCRQAVAKRCITIRDSGLSWRNFVPMGDVVRVLHLAAQDLPNGIYNVGSPQSLALREMAERVSKVCEEALDFRPPVYCRSRAETEQCVPLHYRSDRLANAGFLASDSFEHEVRQTLLMARATFRVGARG